ncbi:ornithine carbamoyltransferase [Rubinisphaera sp. JC750]|uniref:ornithine carbamoyltransferase n=1 Tax=Rubinisphaera sp. JC750 TaxID=2898658 RepID=UPI001EFF7AFD|nr:ornithine carbamoyltransferase [Rubinisphaera sp. JC750]
MKHLLSLFEVTPSETETLLDLSAQLKTEWKQRTLKQTLPGRVLLQIYEKPSLRTRVSFESAMIHLGGAGMFMTEKEAGLRGRESLQDVAQVTSRFADVIVLRTFSQQLIEEFAAASRVPVINGLSDDFHPCQALTDLLTMREHCGDLKGKTLVYLGDGNNVAKSLAICCADVGVNFVLSSPKGYQIEPEFWDRLKQRNSKASFKTEADPKKAVAKADVVYTDVWASMGQEEEAAARRKIFAPYQINAELIAACPKSVKFMHCLPAKRGEEVTDEIMDGERSIVFDQAENRMHIARGVFAWLLDSNN